jgi:ATP-binding cassette subfamily C protein CydD
MQGLEKQIQGKTALMVTHQLTPLQSVEQILVMRDGLIVQSGDFAQLSNQQGLFQEMLKANQALNQANKGNLDA